MSARTQRTLLMLQDAITIAACYLAALYLRFGGAPPAENLAVFPHVAAATVVVNVVLLYLYDTYHDLHRPGPDLLAAVVLASVLGTAASMVVPYALRLTAFPRSLFAIALPLQVTAVALLRLPWMRWSQHVARQRRIAVAAGDGLRDLLRESVRQAFAPREVLDLDPPLPERLAELAPDTVLLGPDLDPALRAELHAACAFRGIRCLIVPTLSDLFFARPAISQVGEFPVFVGRGVTVSPDHAVVKRAADVIGAALLLVVTAPLLLLAAAAIKLAEPRAPVLFRQERVGLHGRRFMLLKLRTMVPDAERHTGPVLSGPDDPRVTPVGRVLRRWRLDELPQLWNVLRGDMSLVGPRPERPEFVMEFEAANPLYALRHAVRPGLTGLAQVLAGYDTDFRDKLRYDLMYVAFASPLLDVKILVLTAKALLFGGSAGRTATSGPAAVRLVPYPLDRWRVMGHAAAAAADSPSQCPPPDDVAKQEQQDR